MKTSLFLAAIGLFVVASCSLTRSSTTDCESNAECRDGFGLGFVCADSGFCEVAATNPRCEKTFPTNLMADPVEAQRRIIVGNLMDRSSTTHQARENAAELAILSANDSGGIGGTEFGIVFCTVEESADFDELERTDAAVASARYLADVIGVHAIVGPAASSDTQAVFVELDSTDSNIAIISPSATSPALTDLEPAPTDETPGLLWRTAASDVGQSAAIVFDMTTPGTGRIDPVLSVAVVFESGAYGDALSAAFIGEFQLSGGTVESFRFDGDTQRNEAITAAGLSANVEVLFISSQFTDIVSFLDGAAASQNYENKTIFLTDAAANRDVLTTANPARFGNIRGTRPAPLDESTDQVYANFLTSYAAEFGDDAKQFSFVANAYDAAWLIAYGAAWAVTQESELTGRTIARGLRQLSSGESIPILPSNWNAAQNRISAGNMIDVLGASGSLDFDPATEETVSDVEIWTVSGTDITGAYTFNPT